MWRLTIIFFALSVLAWVVLYAIPPKLRGPVWVGGLRGLTACTVVMVILVVLTTVLTMAGGIQ